jgi:hypothetical protein
MVARNADATASASVHHTIDPVVLHNAHLRVDLAQRRGAPTKE